MAILAGVSTEQQATPDKLSIPDQLARCRERIEQSGGVESSGPYILDGYSRSGYDSLEVAMAEIPPLAQAIHDATADRYDILVMDNFDRLGDLGFIVKTRFKKLRKQLYSVRQSGKLTPPHLYDPYATEGDDIAMYVEGIIQAYRINKIRRGWNIGVPERARQGLHPTSVPFGYRLVAKDQPVQPQPDETRLILDLVRAYLNGQTLTALVDLATASGVRPPRSPRWHINVIQKLLHNQFYAGVTAFGKYKTVQGKRIPIPPSQWITGTGKHQPLYDQDTYQKILLETERRSHLRARTQVYALTGLLSCAHCQQRLHRHGKLNTRYKISLSCPQGHVHIFYDVALQLVSSKIAQELHTLVLSPETSENLSERFLEANNALLAERQHIQDGFRAKIYTETEAARLITQIEQQLQTLQHQHTQTQQHHQQRQTLQHLATQTAPDLQAWILQDDPTTVNHLLTALCTTITITSGYELTVSWR